MLLFDIFKMNNLCGYYGHFILQTNTSETSFKICDFSDSKNHFWGRKSFEVYTRVTYKISYKKSIKTVKPHKFKLMDDTTNL